MRGREKLKKGIVIFIFASFIVPLGFLGYMIIVSPSIPEGDGRLRSDYILMFLQCLLGAVALILPIILSKRISLEIPSLMYLLFVVFLYCAIFLGEVRDFYHVIPYWDTILHAFSGAMLGALGFSFVELLNKNHILSMRLSPLFVAIFAFTFALSLGVIWEIYEFTGDSLLDMNMQRYRLIDGTGLVGRDALMDTMKDIIVDAISAGAMCVVGYFSLKHKTGLIDRLKIRYKDSGKKLNEGRAKKNVKKV